MERAPSDFSRLAKSATLIGLHEHLCLIYETRGAIATSVPFFRAGLQQDQRCRYIADYNTAETALAAIATALHPPQSLIFFVRTFGLFRVKTFAKIPAMCSRMNFWSPIQ